MHRFFSFVIALILYFFSCSVEAKTYRISKPIDLNGITLELKAGSKVVFKKDGRIINGTVKGNNCKFLVKTNAPVFEKVKLKGSYRNTDAYLSWWECDEDLTVEVESLVSAFNGTVYLDREGKLTRPITVENNKTLIIDGCGNTFYLFDISGFSLFFEKSRNIEVRNAHFRYLSSNPGTNSLVGVLRVKHTVSSKINVHHVSIEGFDNSLYNPCGVGAILIEGCCKGTETVICDVTVKDMIVKGDGKETNGVGANYAISLDCHEREAGGVEIYNCCISNMYNVDSIGNKIYEDTSGIYLGGAFKRDKEGNMVYCDWHSTIHDCRFKDISKRNIKIQGNYVSLYNLYSVTTSDFLTSFQNMYVGIEGDNIRVENINGQYDGAIVKMTGDNLVIKGMNCTSALRDSEYACVIKLDGTLHSVIEDCIFNNDTYMFIYPTERGFNESTEPVYIIKRCVLNVKNILYCISDYSSIFHLGKLIIEDSDISLTGAICSNSKSLDCIILRESLLKHKGILFSPQENGRPKFITEKSIINRF